MRRPHPGATTLTILIPWSRKRFGLVHPHIQSWLVAVRAHLERATAQEPTPPADWSRPASVDCKCQYCEKLKGFLADPSLEVARIPAPEHSRQHLIGRIGQDRCDVSHTLERKGSPYSLVLSKTTGSFDRAVQRFEADRRLLSALASVS